jgi:hypothetical protein
MKCRIASDPWPRILTRIRTSTDKRCNLDDGRSLRSSTQRHDIMQMQWKSLAWPRAHRREKFHASLVHRIARWVTTFVSHAEHVS